MTAERKVYTQQLKSDTNTQINTSNDTSKPYILTTVLLAIKGDHTTISLPFGLSQRRDMCKALSRIGTDATMEDCLVGSEVLSMPNKQVFNIDTTSTSIGRVGLLSEKEILDAFPDLTRLS